MTCVVGVSEGGRVLVAADSCVLLDDYEETTSPDPKVVQVADWIVGVAGHWSGVLAARSISVDAGSDIGSLWNQLKVAMGEWSVPDDEWTVLAARQGQLWVLDGVSAPLRIDSRQAGAKRQRVTRSTWAIGSGAAYARGALLALDDAGLTMQQRAETALEIAHRCASGVRPPWRHLEG